MKHIEVSEKNTLPSATGLISKPFYLMFILSLLLPFNSHLYLYNVFGCNLNDLLFYHKFN